MIQSWINTRRTRAKLDRKKLSYVVESSQDLQFYLEIRAVLH